MAALRSAKEIRSETGQTMAEYAVVLAVISLIVVAAMTLLATNAAGAFTRLAGFLNL